MLNRLVVAGAAAAIFLAGGPSLAQIGHKDKEKSAQKDDKKKSGSIKVGSAAPSLSIEKWLKGDQVSEFESGKVYVVEFWATWCPPCIKSIPHLSELQKKHKNAVVIGVAASERGDDKAAKLDKLEKFVKEQGSKMSYRVAYDEDRSMSNDWMQAAGQNGIPCAFIVGHDGKVAFIGHPSGMDSALDEAMTKAKGAKKGAMLIPSFNPSQPALAFQDSAKKEGQEAKKDEPKKEAKPELTLFPGVKAPAIEVAKFVKGEPITSFEKGQFYVVEFWATWCGPCMKAIPHLSELQEQYKSKGVHMLGVSVWEADQAKVEPFATGKEDMKYTVASDQVPNLPDDIKPGTREAQRFYNKNGKMSQNWMAAAQAPGIPTSFIVDGTSGNVIWIGSPFSIDEPLKLAVEGKLDVAKEAEKYKTKVMEEQLQMEAQPKMARFQRSLTGGDTAAAYKLGAEIAETYKNNPMILNFIAWTIVDPESDVEKKDLDLALRAASRAVEITKSEDAAILDTLARVYFVKGDVDKAIELQTKALAKATDKEKEQLQPALDEYKAKKGK